MKQTPPNLIGQPYVPFRPTDFDAVIWNKGYALKIEKAVACPCRGTDGSPLSDCENCYGLGYFYINPFDTRAIMTSLNSETKLKEWSLEKLGTVSFTLMSEYSDGKVSFNDRFTLTSVNEDSPTPFASVSEVRQIQETETEKFVFLTFMIKEIMEVWSFNLSSSLLTRIDPSLYSLSDENPYVLKLDPTVNPTNNVVSVRYKHLLQYIVVDIPHEVRSSLVRDDNGADKTIELPNQFVAKRINFAAKGDYNGLGLLDNSYKE